MNREEGSKIVNSYYTLLDFKDNLSFFSGHIMEVSDDHLWKIAQDFGRDSDNIFELGLGCYVPSSRIDEIISGCKRICDTNEYIKLSIFIALREAKDAYQGDFSQFLTKFLAQLDYKLKIDS